MNYKLRLVILFLAPMLTQAQTGGKYAFQNLNTQYNARTMGLGGDAITIYDSDLNLALNNPAILNDQMNGKFGFNQTIMSSGVNTGALTYARKIHKTMGMLNFRYTAYGKMKRTDELGIESGTFSPGDFILGASAQHAFNQRMSVGATFNILYSQLDSYTAFGTSLDIAGLYRDSARNLTLVGVIKNLGAQWKGYTKERNPLPLEVQLGISHKLKHAPFRFSLVAQHLQKWNLAYNDPNAQGRIDPLTGDSIQVKKAGFFENLARHAKIQLEILIGKKFHLSTAFDYQRRKELAIVGRGGLAGFSFGAGFAFKRFSIDYGWYIYSAAGGQHGLTLNFLLSKK
ncbi:type IX secretion system protein PorQ [Fluviicola taffensis]|uniref:Type IX secretion system protein PorQ n=1 Tax=Fluviicola taffensis (strain DSM 16823 / NCIMB 13979 / RW262) TaxID=755732 RepID=F2IGV8_FLUTR|nr:type IX secretion system protein PorQ [Fluviicola taffensis]AEA44739.1 hypothetical protein Fluta_2759 [Fluviicola taffensis DSM 16823]